MGWVSELGRRNKSAMRELAGKLRDEGDEGAREKKKKFEEERRKKRSWREREKKGKEYFNERGERSVIKKNIYDVHCNSKLKKYIYIYIYIYIFLALNYTAHLKIDVHGS